MPETRPEEMLVAVRELCASWSGPGGNCGWITDALRASQGDKERFHRTAIGQPPRRYLAVQSKLDRAYDDRLAQSDHGREMWSRKSSEWETELETIRAETTKHEQASHDSPSLDRNARTRRKRP